MPSPRPCGRTLAWLTLGAWLWAASAPALAQPQPTVTGAAAPTLTLERALERARLAYPGLAASTRAVEAARAAIRQARLRPNPQVEVDVAIENLTRVESSGLFVSQELESGGKRPARVRLAEAELSEAELQVADTARALRADVIRAFARLLFAQALLDVRREAVDLTRRQAELTRRRVDLGDAAAIEPVQLETELARRAAAASIAEGQRQAAAIALAPLLAQPTDADLRAEGPLGREPPLPPLDQLVALAVERRPDLLLARARVRTREADVALQRALGVPNPTVGAGVSRERTFIDEDAFSPPGVIERVDDRDWVVGLRLQIPIPINRNQGNVARTQALVEEARLREDLARRQVEAEVADAYRRLLAARAARRQLRDEALPRTADVLGVIEKAYDLGARTIVDVLVARDAYVQARVEALEAARDEELALADLEAATGLPLTPETAPGTESTP